MKLGANWKFGYIKSQMQNLVTKSTGTFSTTDKLSSILNLDNAVIYGLISIKMKSRVRQSL